MSEFVEPAYLSLFSCGYGVWIRVNPCGILPIPAFPKSGKEQQSFRICLTMRFRVVFGLFGLSENSSFSSTLRAWFAFAHSSPYRKSNRAIPGRIWIIRVVRKLIVFLYLTGLVRFRSLIALPKIQPE